jgi:hypothetical protein
MIQSAGELVYTGQPPDTTRKNLWEQWSTHSGDMATCDQIRTMNPNYMEHEFP